MNEERAEAAAEDDAADDAGDKFEDEPWQRAPFQLGRAIAALPLTAAGFGLYEYVLVSFWSSPSLGIYDRTPWPVYLIMIAALVMTLGAVYVALSLESPHAKLGFGMLAFLACLAVGVGGGRFVSYMIRGTRNPPFQLALKDGDRFPSFSLEDQNAQSISGPTRPGASAGLIYVYRGDFCPFSRFELDQLTKRNSDFERAGVAIVAISADPVERSSYLAKYLHTSIPLLSDQSETILKPLGLVQTHRDGEPDSAIAAFMIVDRDGIVRWTFTSPYYRELPTPEALLDAARAVAKGDRHPRRTVEEPND
jgi:peroxiredoxin